MSHELQSPLARMKLAIELLPDQRHKDRLARDVGNMEKLVAELLEAARIGRSHQGLEMQALDLAALVQAELGVYDGSKPRVKYMGPARPVVAKVDASRISAVLRNLVDNALKYSGESGDAIEVQLSDSAKAVELSIRDYGSGIPDDEQRKLFQPFYRVDKSRSKDSGGYGLGLNLCQRIVISHGGNIALKSG